jgi:hypothetical protein
MAVIDPELPPDEINELAEACRQYVGSAFGVELDYRAETLSLLDHYLLQARPTVADRPELRELIGRTAGAYFGEVVRRTFPSFWKIPSADAHGWRICMSDVFLAFNPVAVAWDALLGTTEHEGPSALLETDPTERETLANRFAQMPDVPDDEFWLVSTRLEVVEVAIETLRLEMERSGTEKVTFDEYDYEDEIKPIGQA